ncbi:MAG: gliding motility-associated protein GldE [Bacteroidales bacterium]|nr:gliding motility-associated protein GldE [Bacteroidales bacterium]
MEAIDPFQKILLLQTTALTTPIIIEITVLLLLLLCSALISGSEVAFFSLDRDDIRELSKMKTSRSAAIARLLGKPEELISTIIISNTFINIAIVLLSAYIYEQLSIFSGNRVNGLLLEIIIITSILILFGEVIPRVYAAKANVRFSRLMALPLDLCRKIFRPLSTFLIRSGSLIKRRAGQKEQGLSKGELSHAISLASGDNRDDEKILKGIVKFGNIESKEIMRPRIDIMAIDMKSAFREVIKQIIDSGYSRVPVYSGTFDSIHGILYVKDILPYYHKQNTFKWQSLLRPPYFVPETKKINDLLEEFQKKKIHMAIVTDEYGSTSGIITLEDILEEIVGEIPDENDTEEISFEKINDNIYIFEGKTLLNDFFKLMDIESDPFEEVRGNSDTLAGLILELTGEIPGAGYSIDYKKFRFSILAADKRRIKKLRVEIRKKANEKKKS